MGLISRLRLAAAARSGEPEAIQRLLAGGADPNEAAGNGVTALMTAARAGRAEAVRVLATAGAMSLSS